MPAYGPKNFAKWLIKLRKNENNLIFQYWSVTILNGSYEIRLGGVRQAYIVS